MLRPCVPDEFWQIVLTREQITQASSTARACLHNLIAHLLQLIIGLAPLPWPKISGPPGANSYCFVIPTIWFNLQAQPLLSTVWMQLTTLTSTISSRPLVPNTRPWFWIWAVPKQISATFSFYDSNIGTCFVCNLDFYMLKVNIDVSSTPLLDYLG